LGELYSAAHGIRPDSFRFRYADSKEGVPYLPTELKNINLRHFSDTVERLADYLDALDTAVGVLCDAKQDMEAEYNQAPSR
jgi:hypothetical protein